MHLHRGIRRHSPLQPVLRELQLGLEIPITAMRVKMMHTEGMWWLVGKDIIACSDEYCCYESAEEGSMQ
jgi:hypothetical protein